MPPNVVAAPAAPYAIVYTPFATGALKTASSAARWPLTEAILALQDSPRPDGHQAADEYGPGTSAILVEQTSPTYLIIYRIDEAEQRIVVIALTEKRW
jgi:hypothetical protein